MKVDATPRTLLLLGVLAAFKAAGLVLLAEGVATGIVAAIGGSDVTDAVRLTIAAGILRAVASWATQVVATRAAISAKSQLRGDLVERVLRGHAGPIGTITAIGTVGLDELDNYYRNVLPAVVATAVIPLLVGVRILTADWLSALIVVLTVPLVPVFMALVGLHTQKRADAASATLTRLSDHLVELGRGLPVLVGLGRVDDQTAALRRISDDHRTTTMATLRSAFLSSLVLEVISTISVAIVAVAVGIRLVHGDMPLALGLVALVLAPECFAPFRELGAAFHSSQDGLAAARRARDVIAAPAAASIVRGGDALRVDGLTVAYEGRPPAVDNVSFEVRRNSTVSIEGPSGSGKTTVLRALAGDLDASVTGFISGVSDVAWVPQHPHTVGDTVADELALYGGSSALALRLGLDPLAECARLSPGELRRLAVARGIARVEAGASLLLLDEPTAHLDPVNASMVEAEIAALRGTVTIVIASHEASVAALASHRVLLAPTRLRATDPLAPLPNAVTAPGSHGLDAENITSAPTYEPPTPAFGRGTLRELASYLRPTRWRFAAAAVLGTGASLFAIALTATSGWLIVRASEQPPIMYLLVAIVGVRFFGLGRSVLRYVERLLTHDAVLGSLTGLRMRLWNGLAASGVASRTLTRGGVALDYLVASADRVRDLVPRVLLPIVVGLLSALGVAVAVAALHPAALPTLAWCLAVCLLVSPAVALLADRSAARGQALVRSTSVRRLAATVAAAGELRANGTSAAARDSLSKLDATAGSQARRTAGALGLGGALTILTCCVTAGLMLLSSTGADPGIVAVLVLLPVALIEPLLALIDAAQQAPALAAALHRVAAVTTVEPERTDGEPVELIGELALADLSAGWPGTAPAFHGASTSLTRGDWLVVEGPSGSGKSTLLATLLGYLSPASGTVLVNGVDTRTLSLQSLRSLIAWCPQESHLFDSTIRGNLLIARPHDDRPTDATLLDTLDRVGLGTLMAGLPQGLDTRLGPEGQSLSGGQRQRLAVARTLLARADVVLLDEPTAHLDAQAASYLLSDLRTALADKIVVMVTHHASDVLATDARLRLGAVLVE